MQALPVGVSIDNPTLNRSLAFPLQFQLLFHQDASPSCLRPKTTHIHYSLTYTWNISSRSQ
jgi:hypothetical protein